MVPKKSSSSSSSTSSSSSCSSVRLMMNIFLKYILGLTTCYFTWKNLQVSKEMVRVMSEVSMLAEEPSMSLSLPYIDNSNDNTSNMNRIVNITNTIPTRISTGINDKEQERTTRSTMTTTNVASTTATAMAAALTITTSPTPKTTPPPTPTVTIAYAITVTDCQNEDRKSNKNYFLDYAAILKHSIHLVHKKNQTTDTTMTRRRYYYDYKMYAFVHPDASNCSIPLSKLGYNVQVKDIPLLTTNLSEIPNQKLVQSMYTNGCCGPKELLKLYSYTLEEHPIVVHLDLDCILLKPLTHLYDWMLLLNDEGENEDDDVEYLNQLRQQIYDSVMYPEQVKAQAQMKRNNNTFHQLIPPSPSALFTRDYSMVNPIRGRLPIQVGVQGGFFIVKPNMTIFQQYLDIIQQDTSYEPSKGWGGRPGSGKGNNGNGVDSNGEENIDVSSLRYGGYWGDPTIQGIMSYYYGKYSSQHAHAAGSEYYFVELNKCIYNVLNDESTTQNSTLYRKNQTHDPIFCYIPKYITNPEQRHEEQHMEQQQQQEYDKNRILKQATRSKHFIYYGVDSNSTHLLHQNEQSLCSDCRQKTTSIEQVYVAHLTVCGKPTWCINPEIWPNIHNLCMEFHKQWHFIRKDLEHMWMELYPPTTPKNDTNSNSTTASSSSGGGGGGYQPNLANLKKRSKVQSKTTKYYLEHYQYYHCQQQGRYGYKRLRYPQSFYNNHNNIADGVTTTKILWK